MDARTLFFNQFDRATHSAEKVANTIHHNHWRDRPQYHFGPGELLVHLVQSERFNLNWILHGIGRNLDFTIPGPFLPIVEERDPKEKRRKLNELNLEAARERLLKFSNLSEVQAWWKEQRTVTRGTLLGIPAAEFEARHVRHPIVTDLEGPCIFVCAELMIAHLYYHCGQATQVLKNCGDYRPPMVMGEITVPASS